MASCSLISSLHMSAPVKLSIILGIINLAVGLLESCGGKVLGALLIRRWNVTQSFSFQQEPSVFPLMPGIPSQKELRFSFIKENTVKYRRMRDKDWGPTTILYDGVNHFIVSKLLSHSQPLQD